MKTVLWTAVILIAIVLQSTLLPLLSIAGVKPDLLLVATVSAGLLYGKEHGVGMGFFAGLLQDLASGNVFGLNVLTKMGIGYLFGTIEQKVFKEHILLPIMAAAAATLLHGIGMVILLYIFGYKVYFSSFMVSQVMPSLLYNSFAAVPVHHIIHRASQRVSD